MRTGSASGQLLWPIGGASVTSRAKSPETTDVPSVFATSVPSTTSE
jgi:hypothetical protein